MKKWTFFLTLVFQISCGSDSNFKGEGQITEPKTYTSDAEPEAPVVPEPAPIPKPKPEPLRVPACPKPVKPVAAGSFVVWTEPECPQPFEVYEVVIKVTLPANIAATYNPIDLGGNIVGTDGFGKGFGPGSGTVVSWDALKDGGIMRVPLYRGADIVNETVQINSIVLKEYQAILLAY